MSESSSAETGGSPFESALDTGGDRFLAQILAHALDDSWRTAEDFLQHFPPEEIIGSLAEAHDLRAELLVHAAGVHERLAHKKSVASGAEDLSIALDEGICDPTGVLDVYKPDDRVRHLDHAKLWAFVTEEGFWNIAEGEPGHATGVARITFIVERGLEQELLTLADIVGALTIDTIAERLPEEVVRRVVAHALNIAAQPCPLDANALFEVVPLADLVSYVPLDFTWQNLVQARLAAPLGLAEEAPAPSQPESEAKPKPEPEPEPEPRASKPPPKPAAKKQATPSKPPKARSVPPPPPAAPDTEPPPQPPPDELPPEDEFDVTIDEAAMEIEPPEPALSPAEAAALEEAAEALRALDRLPPSYQKLSIPILRSIESMYADLSDEADDAGRESVIRESFPNEAHLRKAMLAMIELLDPSIDTNEQLIRDADVDALIKIVLFEERRRDEQREGGSPSRRSVPPGRRA